MQPIDPESPEARLLPPATISPTNAVAVTIIPASDAPAELAVVEQPITVKPTVRIRQLSEVPKAQLDQLAGELGVNPSDYKSQQQLIAAIHERRQLIAAMDRETMLEVLRWGRRPISDELTREQLAQEIVQITSMKFDGLSREGLQLLGQLRNVRIGAGDGTSALTAKLKRKESIFEKLNRKRRAILGSMVSNMLGENPSGDDAKTAATANASDTDSAAGNSRNNTSTKAGAQSIKKEIEEAGLIGGITGRIKRSADEYLNTKLDEIESRIDRKLDEIDRRLSEWRDKEIANRIRIMKITLWASVVVGIVSLLYFYIKETVHPTVPLVAPPMTKIVVPATQP